MLCLIPLLKQQFIKTYINGRNHRYKHKKSNILFSDDMIDIRNFHSNLSKVDKKSHKDIAIYYIGYITIKKFSDCENIHSANP